MKVNLASKVNAALHHIFLRHILSTGTSSFHLAAYKGDIKSLYLILLSQTIDLNAETSQGWTPFGLAATAGHLTTAEYLICQGADLQLFGSVRR